MLGIITLLIAICARIGLLVYQLKTKNEQAKTKHYMRIASFCIFTLLLLVNVYWWGFRWTGLFILLGISSILSVIALIKKREKEYKTKRVILSCINGILLIAFAVIPGIIFPQSKPVEVTGSYKVKTESYTFIDESRIEIFSDDNENRKISVQFWYPDEDGKYPLVVFSHGSFGYRMSNYSTFENLASNGYVVCSIDHTYHSFFSEHNDGSFTLVNTEFLNDVTNIENGLYDEKKTYDLTKEWLSLRTKDMAFVLDEILDNTKNVYSLIDKDKIGLFGHSLGGAAAAVLGRERDDIDSVIVIDGTMIGERLNFNEGSIDLNDEAYPLPLLNLYNQEHYNEAQLLKMDYENYHASANAKEAYDVLIRNSGHLNFTDLPLFSPLLAKMLGTGNVDKEYCIETMNEIVLEFFNYTLKGYEKIDLKSEY